MLTSAAHEPRVPATALVRRALTTPAGRTLLVGLIAVGVLFVFTAANLAGQAALWENAHWTVAAVAASAAAWLGVRRGDPWSRPVRRWAATALTIWTLGQIAWNLEVFVNDTSIPSVADLLWLASAVPIFLAFRATFASSLRPADQAAVYLDSGAVFWAIVGVLLYFIGPSAIALGGLGGMLFVVYPSIFFGTAGASLVSALANHARPRLGGPYAILVGMLLFGTAQTIWAVDSINQQAVTPGRIESYPISIAVLLLGYGAATWNDSAEISLRFARIASVVRLALPLIAIAIAAALTVAASRLETPVLETAIDIMVALVVVCTGLRQALLLRDRAKAVDDLKATHNNLLEALADAELAAVAQHRVADERGRVLAASERLLGAAHPAIVLREVLALVVPLGATGFVTRWHDGGRVVEMLAAHGPGTEPFLGVVTRVADAPTDLAVDYDRRAPAGFSRRGTEFVPTSMAPDGSDYGSIVPSAASALTLPFMAGDGTPLGAVHLIDPSGERVLQPAFFDFARLVTNQIAVALQNSDLIHRLRAQIEEIRRVQDQLVVASRLTAIGELAAAVAHEVNNPLTGVLGYADLMLAETPLGDTSREGLQVIRDEAIRARTVVWALLDFARPRPPELRPVDVASLVRSTLDLTRYHLESGGVTVVEQYAPMAPVALDESAIRQVLLNLLNNAAQAMAGAGTLIVSTRLDGADCVIGVQDDGAGMTDAVRLRMFEPFFTTKPMEAGRGLGLSVSLGLVESHGGRITVDSTDGRGTTVEVRLPIHASAPSEGGTDGVSDLLWQDVSTADPTDLLVVNIASADRAPLEAIVS